jgi:hypothetical protein
MFVGGREASRGVVIGWWFWPLWYLPMEYRIVKWVLTRQCLLPGMVMMSFRHVPQTYSLSASPKGGGALGRRLLSLVTHVGRR